MSRILHEDFPIYQAYQPDSYAALSDHMHNQDDVIQDRRTGLVFVSSYADVQRLLVSEGNRVSNANTLAPLTPDHA